MGLLNPLSDCDWNIRVLFLRSKASPHFYLLNTWGHKRIHNSDPATPFDSVKLANELLRIDLNSFFSEMACWHLYYRKCRPAYILADSKNQPPYPRLSESSKQNIYRKDAPCWKRFETMPYVNRVDGFEFKTLVFSSRDECRQWSQTLPPLSPDFDAAVAIALEHSTRGGISSTTKGLLTDACSVCLNSRIPDPLYYSFLFETTAVECSEINELFNAICSEKDLIKRYNVTELFGSSLGLRERSSGGAIKNNSFKLMEEPYLSTYDRVSDFEKLSDHRVLPSLGSTNLDYLRSLYAITLQACADSLKALSQPNERALVRNLETQLIQAYIGISNRELDEIAENLNNVIRTCSRLLRLLHIQNALGNTVKTISILLNDLKVLKNSAYLRSLVQDQKQTPQKTANNTSIQEMKNYLKEQRNIGRLCILDIPGSKSNYQAAPLNDKKAFSEQIKRQAIIRFAQNTCLLETEWSFSKFYARLLNELLECGKLPVRCKKCGSLFFPTGQSSKYCDRFDSSTNLYCNPRLNEKHRLGRKAPHGTAINLHKKAETALQLNEKHRRAYFMELEEFVDHEIGPVYFKSTLISDELYDTWRAAINIPKNQPKAKTPENLGFPRPVIWETKLIDGNQKIAVYLNQHAHPLLRKKLNQLAGSSKSTCSVINNPRIPYGGWILSVFDFLRLIVSTNSNTDQVQDGPIPIPGLGQMTSFVPKDSPRAMLNRKGSLMLQFPSAGKESKILFELQNP